MVLTSGGEQNFLGQRWIPLLFKIAPKYYQRALALRLLAISPHYFYQQSSYDLETMSRSEWLEAEYQRNALSKKIVCDDILKPHLRPQMDVLDFGCGPGFLAREVAKNVHHVTGVDISRGVISCAKVFDNLPNITYCENNGNDLSMLPNEQFHLIYSFEVIQHLSEELFVGFLREFFRVLKSNGKCVCNIQLNEGPSAPMPANKPRIVRKAENAWTARFIWREADKVRRQISEVGFNEPVILPIAQLSDRAVDEARKHLIVFDKP
jgi:ubiquinone/menaquinone biosynthesis C-methylase UbiE